MLERSQSEIYTEWEREANRMESQWIKHKSKWHEATRTSKQTNTHTHTWRKIETLSYRGACCLEMLYLPVSLHAHNGHVAQWGKNTTTRTELKRYVSSNACDKTAILLFCDMQSASSRNTTQIVVCVYMICTRNRLKAMRANIGTRARDKMLWLNGSAAKQNGRVHKQMHGRSQTHTHTRYRIPTTIAIALTVKGKQLRWLSNVRETGDDGNACVCLWVCVWCIFEFVKNTFIIDATLFGRFF